MKKTYSILFLLMILPFVSIQANEFQNHGEYQEIILPEEKVVLVQTIQKYTLVFDTFPEFPHSEVTSSLQSDEEASRLQLDSNKDIPEGVHLEVSESALIPSQTGLKSIPPTIYLQLPESTLTPPHSDEAMISMRIHLTVPNDPLKIQEPQIIPEGTQVIIPNHILNKYREEKDSWDNLTNYLASVHAFAGPSLKEKKDEPKSERTEDAEADTHYLPLNLVGGSDKTTDDIFIVDLENLKLVDETKGLFITLYNTDKDSNHELTEYFLGLSAKIPF